jgi:hypothetical protein
MSGKKYWCPSCGDLSSCDFAGIADLVPHREHCQTLTEILSVDPLDVPEPTTWGESHPVGAVCSYYAVDDDTYTILVCGRRFGCIDDGAAAVAGPRVCHDVPDIVTAINYVAGVKT